MRYLFAIVLVLAGCEAPYCRNGRRSDGVCCSSGACGDRCLATGESCRPDAGFRDAWTIPEDASVDAYAAPTPECPRIVSCTSADCRPVPTCPTGYAAVCASADSAWARVPEEISSACQISGIDVSVRRCELVGDRYVTQPCQDVTRRPVCFPADPVTGCGDECTGVATDGCEERAPL